MSKEAKPDAWMPLYIGDWDGDTANLDCEQDGAYGRLVRHYWRKGAPPDDDHQLARIVRMQLARWRKIRPAVAPYFTITDGLWRHGRVERELANWAEKKRAYMERAAAGGRAKAAKSTASSTTKALLKRCTSSGREEEVKETSSSPTAVDQVEARHEGASPGSPLLRVVGGLDEETSFDPPPKGSPEDRKRLAAEVRASIGRRRRGE